MKKNIVYGAILHLIWTQGQAFQAPAISTLEVSSDTQIPQHLPSQPQNRTNPINCDYKISAETTVSQTLVLSWAEQAALQSFNFHSASIDAQLQQLQACYTENGWAQFKSALLKSRNIEVIKTQNLAVSSQADGPAQLIETLDDQWKITLPLKVVYQNNQERVVHFLSIYLTVGRKITGDLAIMQMIATPRTPPLSLKFKAIEEMAQNIYSVLAQKTIDAGDAAHKIVQPFWVSLLSTRLSSRSVDIGPTKQQAALTQKMQPPNATSFKHTQLAQAFTLNWLDKIANQHPDFAMLNIPVEKFNAWYTEQELAKIQTTIQKSNNIAVNKLQALMSDANDRQDNDNRGKITLPVSVSYQNAQNQVTQLLNINFTVDWKISNDLEKMATPRIASLSPTTASSSFTEVASNDVNQQLATQTKQPEQAPLEPPSAQVNPYLTSEQQKQTEIINCNYRIPAETKIIDQTLVLNWTKQAALQSFSFNCESIDNQLQQLQSCYTDSGWLEFKAALDRSGNIEAIKTQKLTMSSQLEGQPKLLEATDNQWQINLPLKVVYQNSKEKITQLVNIHLTVGRKVTGDLGIMQIIATLGTTPTPSPN
ncbi:DotI/IcmL family type IV secretion protein [Legionella brunensis]|uniref:IcmL-like protein n=1 Tax=Legionella brunensis TaxID=29422 RepID=A0A0W0SM69_9GAMM|nr:DotI/IcmL family type IV secretion protein [Legionella brunensis]KTC84480.1 IcmL-like protein [Legionella brunensis]